MDYSSALASLGPGKRVARAVWPPGMFLILVPGSTITVTADRPLGKAAPELVGSTITYATHVDRYYGGLMSAWFCNKADETATDWEMR